ncbi:MAG: tetratricopeptide (TPR) repeat protein [Planctomycetota bacterium]|jgi:tetratricopeptide (TPR) repeat protein
MAVPNSEDSGENSSEEQEARSTAANQDVHSLGRGGMIAMAVVLGLGLLLRLAYLAAQPASDPFLEHPFLDGKLYLEWARALVAGTHTEEGAFYHAPLYPHVLAVFLRITGDSLRGVFLLQALLSLGTAWLLGWIGTRRFGASAGVATVALVVFHQPVLFFAATPMGETLALFLLAAALALRERRHVGVRGVAGLVLGLSALARPNFLFVGLLLGLWDLARRDWKRAGGFALGAAIALIPVAAHNYSASGHFVPVSSNGGVTLYHGNAAGARGIYRGIPGTSGNPSLQRAETTALARGKTGDDLDPVEADAWWGAEARQARLDDLGGTLGLLARRVLLSLENQELSLDYDPLLDANPWRPVLRFGGADVPGAGFQLFVVPFALIFGLAVLGLFARGWAGSGGLPVWGPILACLATPVLFYVSSRYRLPFAVLLTLPAGVGVASLMRSGDASLAARGAGLLALLISMLPTAGDLPDTGRRQSLSNRLGVLTQAGEFRAAERSGLAALELGETYELHFNMGYLHARMGRTEEALEDYGASFRLDQSRPEAAREFGLLLTRGRRFQEALGPLEVALAKAPKDQELWSALAACYREIGDTDGMNDVLERAGRAGVRLR